MSTNDTDKLWKQKTTPLRTNFASTTQIGKREFELYLFVPRWWVVFQQTEELNHNWPQELLYDPNQPKSFHFAAWNTFTNPDLTFYTHENNSSLPHPVHNAIGNFSKSQHRPTVIHHPALIEYTPTTQIPCWNFIKANWEQFRAATRNMCDDLPSPELDINACFVAFQEKLLKATKESIPRGFWKKCIPKWDAMYDDLPSWKKQRRQRKNFHQTVWLNTWTPSEKINGSPLLKMLTWNVRVGKLGQLTGRKHVSLSPNTMSPNAVASCLLSNGKFKVPKGCLPIRTPWALEPGGQKVRIRSSLRMRTSFPSGPNARDGLIERQP